MRERLRLYFIMGSRDVGSKNPLEVLEEACHGGITLFQFREKGDGSLKGEDRLVFARECQCICRRYKVPFIVNDDMELAIELEADGVHLGRNDVEYSVARSFLGEGKIIGLTAHNPSEAVETKNLGADYIGVGAVFPTLSKADAGLLPGLHVLSEVRAQLPDYPIVGIGGISEEYLEEVLRAGVDGVAVISEIARAAKVREKVGRLIEKIDGYFRGE